MGSGKLWLARDWQPEHLVPIYAHWQDRIGDAVLTSVLDPAPQSGA